MAAPLTVAITGASGFLGSALSAYLSKGGHSVRAVKRVAGGFDGSALQGADVVVNLASAGIADVRWTPERKAELVRSRVDSTRNLVAQLAALPNKPSLLLNASGIGAFGDRGDELLTDTSTLGPPGPNGAAFLAGLCRDWEAAAATATSHGIRAVSLRFGVVCGKGGGALAQMSPPFRLGAGAVLGDGRNYMSWVALQDVVRAAEFVMREASLSGPINLCAPEPRTNREFSKVLGKTLHRPVVLSVPAPVLRVMFGEVADAALLASQRAQPRRLLDAGFRFELRALEACLQQVFST